MRRIASALILSLIVTLGLGAVLSARVESRSGGWGVGPVASARALAEMLSRALDRLPLGPAAMRASWASTSAVMPSEPEVRTTKSDYTPGETAIILGSGFGPTEDVSLQVVHTSGGAEGGAGHEPWTVKADANGDFESSWYVDPFDSLGSTFLLTATGLTSGLKAAWTFTDANESANLDQCANDPAPSPSSNGCSASANDWVNGNLGASKSLYIEGDSIPYRLLFGNLSLASHTVIIEWDTTKSGKHAIDYLTTFNRTVLDANPCLGVAGCNPGVFTTFAIPKDPQVDDGFGSPITQEPGDFRLYGGTITSVSAYSYPNGAGFVGDKSARIAITFTATVADPVLAWGGHIATRQDWGAGTSAVSIPGSPYHTRLISLDGSGGNQDRSLSAEAVIFPASITIIKDAVAFNGPTSPQDFVFTTTGGLSPAGFTLDDDLDPTRSDTQSYTGITVFDEYTVTETLVTGWNVSFLTPVCTVTDANGGASRPRTRRSRSTSRKPRTSPVRSSTPRIRT
jgi:hypothetical protein